MPHVDSPQSLVRLGVSRGDITPPLGIYWRMWGAATKDHAIGVHQPLTATALVLEPLKGEPASQVQSRVVLLSLDHCLLGREENDLVANAVCQAAGLAPAQVLITFTHTHSAGLMSLDRVKLPGGELIPSYLQEVAKTCARLVVEAVSQLQPATIVYGTGRCDLAAQRDYWDQENQCYVCGYDPHTPADDTLLVARATDAAGKVLATIVNYACHPTTLAWENRLISPDFPGTMRQVVEQGTGGAVCLFLQGASGELGPREAYVGDVATAERHGRRLGYAALSTLESLAPPLTHFEYQGPVVSGATLGMWKHLPIGESRRASLAIWEEITETLPLPYRADLPTRAQTESLLTQYSAEEAKAQGGGNAIAVRDAHALAERQRRMLHRLAQLPTGENYPFALRILRLGDAIWIATEGEHYSYLQMNLRARFPGRTILITTLTGGWGPSYVPARATYGKGIYQESIAVVEPGSLERITEELARRVEKLLA